MNSSAHPTPTDPSSLDDATQRFGEDTALGFEEAIGPKADLESRFGADRPGEEVPNANFNAEEKRWD